MELPILHRFPIKQETNTLNMLQQFLIVYVCEEGYIKGIGQHQIIKRCFNLIEVP